MTELLYKENDWIVHSTYGVGQIRSIEKKPIHGETVSAFRVKTTNSVYWLPIENADNSRVRRISSKQVLTEALAQLETESQEMESNYRSRNIYIAEVFSDGTILKKVELLRDLLELRKEKMWSNTENDAAHTIFDQLSSEYSVIYSITINEAQDRINQLIMENSDGVSMM